MKTIFIAQDLWDFFQEAYEEVMTKQDFGKMSEAEDELPSRFKTVEENPTVTSNTALHVTRWDRQQNVASSNAGRRPRR
ncbi:unnamed protein product [Linum trigynum]|uniref:Uncharacterized protein n=1 Tax=Linum trigynum TaxID=586398 RepID=A0AAV2GR94_9ROSI